MTTRHARVAELARAMGVLALTAVAACRTARPLPAPPAEMAAPAETAAPVAAEAPAVLPYRLSPGDVVAIGYYRRPPPASAEAYRVDCSDVLTVSVAGNNGFSTDLTVRPDGQISFFLIGDVPVRGLAVAEVRDALASRLSQRIPAAEVSVFLKRGGVLVETFMETLTSDKRQGASRSVRVKQDGLVNFPLIGEVRVLGKTQTELSAELEDYYARVFRGGLAVSVNTVAGDEGNVAVLGEVRQPGLYTIRDRVDPVYVLAMAGGALDTADLRKAVLVKRSDDGSIRRVDPRLDLLDGASHRAATPMGPKDILIVPKTGIANVNRFVDQYIRRVLPFAPSVGAYYDLNQEN